MCYLSEVCETVWLKTCIRLYVCTHRDMHTTHICIALLKIFNHFKVTFIFLCFFLLLLTCSMQTNIWAFAFLSPCPFSCFIYIIFSMSRPQPVVFFLCFFFLSLSVVDFRWNLVSRQVWPSLLYHSLRIIVSQVSLLSLISFWNCCYLVYWLCVMHVCIYVVHDVADQEHWPVFSDHVWVNEALCM